MSGSHTLTQLSFQGMPNLGVPLARENGTAAEAWYRFFISVYNVTLAGLPILPSGVVPGNPNSLTLASLSGQIVTQGDQITTGAGAIAANTSSIATLQADVIVLQQEINTLQNQVNALAAQLDGLAVLGTSGTASAGGGGAPPASVQAYMSVRVGTSNFRVPLYNP
jgi:hypothetical protein